MSPQAAASDPLGLPGFTFADLHEPARLRDLHDAFVAAVRDTEPELWRQWAQYREMPDALGPVAQGQLIVQMAPHVSRFLARLFAVGPETDALKAATSAYDELFRFKVDFVRRRALPLLKGGARVEASSADHEVVAALVARVAGTEVCVAETEVSALRTGTEVPALRMESGVTEHQSAGTSVSGTMEHRSAAGMEHRSAAGMEHRSAAGME
ncbi:MAG TPA: hypothetical protein PLH72_10535, partial [Vicinamibacterales bacterium]|nr:hypothetical protein [Vicinamibacterales bacterium]